MSTSNIAVEIDIEMLASKALEVSTKAYAPYSNYKVGAAVLTEKGNIFLGCNVENASYGLTICAERNAIGVAVQDEGSDMKIRAIVVLVNSKTNAPLCGGCRQVISEFSMDSSTDETIIIFKGEDGLVVKTIDEILPFRFKF